MDKLIPVNVFIMDLSDTLNFKIQEREWNFLEILTFWSNFIFPWTARQAEKKNKNILYNFKRE